MDSRVERNKLKRKKIKRKRLKRLFSIIALVFFVGVTIVFITDKFFFSVFTVDGESMQRTLYEGDKIIIQKINIKAEDLKQDDIVSFIGNDERLYIKRIIGIPGDVIEIVNGKVLVNGVQKIETYIKGNITESYSQSKWFVKENEFFVLGDNRLKNKSKDSRIFGTINIEQIEGKVVYNFNTER
ncbi:signal peptidase I [Helcococcus kunzii]|mgnify:CR=1 FL=1|uniref:Signal peptidase I n=1 Tax=Helcococcus kunzii ATCC 51366 TaxID=883114 RepID=H3NPL8_9FIRM|nr:signal peptidase I [Helcococcus kunzii]EHR33246.1 signal peptidase I [Helcococcus kunzii ATCC 51366]MCT1795902.1 signal peptidase I [Helcococcus kunzii]MCT1988547.1 signal peptidase I [Helcococcus kunzii]QUY65189.1 signal peptidase I [Helcococcus kunzii]QZO75848.1 signal peptidase I [Helcococcus kunzii]